MGKRGPRATPTEILKLFGSHHQYDRPSEPPTLPGDPDAPDWLTGESLLQWQRSVAVLKGMGIVSPCWRESLAQLVDASREYIDLARLCETTPRLVVGTGGRLRVHPLHRMTMRAADRLLRISREFGFTPASTLPGGHQQ